MALYQLQHGIKNRKINENMGDFSAAGSVMA
jgi:hypothetical protein